MASKHMPSSLDLPEVTPEHMGMHQQPSVSFLNLESPDRKLAYRYIKGKSPTLLYVPGYLSSMDIHKATVMEQYAKDRGFSSLRYDQSSTGQSIGLTRKECANHIWMEEALAMVDLVAKEGPIVLVASSNGGWISTYLATVRPNRIKGMVLVGPAFNYPSELLRILEEGGDSTNEVMEKLKKGEVLRHETPYGDGYFSLDGLRKSMKYEVPFDKGIKADCPVCILHAFGDQEVGWESSVKLLESLEGKDVDLILRKTGNHRLMKSGDLTLLTFTLDRLINENLMGRKFTTPEDKNMMSSKSKL